MTLTLKGITKNGKIALYSGAGNVLRFPLGAFINKTAPLSIEVEGDFAEPKVVTVLTDEQKVAKAAERKAARAVKPKPTLAERVAAAQARADKLAAKLAAMAAPEGAQAI